MASAAGEKLAVVMRMNYLREEAATGRREDFDKYLATVPTETPQGNLVAGMKWLLNTYTSRINHQASFWKCGHARGVQSFATAAILVPIRFPGQPPFRCLGRVCYQPPRPVRVCAV